MGYMATSERSARTGSTHGHGDSATSDDDGVGMAHLTVVPTNFDGDSADPQ